MAAQRRPRWPSNESLREHFRKHGAEVADALCSPRAEFREAEYDTQAVETVNRARFRFEAEKCPKDGPFYPLSRYHVDALLLQAITNVPKTRLFTFFPSSCGRRIPPSELPKLTKADRVEKFKAWVDDLEEAGILQRVKRANGF